MQKRTALAVTALLLGAQFALVQNSRGNDDVRSRTTVDIDGSNALPGEIRLEEPAASRTPEELAFR